MRIIGFILLPASLAACLEIGPDPEATPDRAVRSFNGSSVVIQSKSETPGPEDLALAKSACPDARYTTTNFTAYGVSEYLFLC